MGGDWRSNSIVTSRHGFRANFFVFSRFLSGYCIAREGSGRDFYEKPALNTAIRGG